MNPKVFIVTCLAIFCGEYVYGSSVKRTNHNIDTREVVNNSEPHIPRDPCIVLCPPIHCPTLSPPVHHNESTPVTGRTTEATSPTSSEAPEERVHKTYHLKTEHFKDFSKKHDDRLLLPPFRPPCIRLCECSVGECEGESPIVPY
ncbi:uncharacterized protein LOC109597921 [Aethina tumida]|uniref:uncharacterized protein LOC109597921 n=1 Tax=Aethina tumida TaxID=116153 RepID=UPI002147B52B|nr:uncharacterized protein LOC109597921 [Aethina tumida]